jgi:hypothetical protein
MDFGYGSKMKFWDGSGIGFRDASGIDSLNVPEATGDLVTLGEGAPLLLEKGAR